MHPRLAHFGSVVIPTYGVIAAAGLVCSILFAEWCAARAGVPAERVWNLCTVIAIGTLLLSRLILIAQSPRAFRTYPWLLLSLPTVTRFGLLLALASAAAYIAFARMPWLRTLDAIAPAALLFSGFLHLGSFFAGTDLGSGTTLAIGSLVSGDEGHHPVALYAAFASFLGAAIATLVLRRQRTPGRAFGTVVSMGAAGSFFSDQFRPSYTLPQTVLPGFLRIDQIFFILLTAAGMLFLLDRKGTHA